MYPISDKPPIFIQSESTPRLVYWACLPRRIAMVEVSSTNRTNKGSSYLQFQKII